MDESSFMVLNTLIKHVDNVGYNNLDKGTKEFINYVYYNYDEMKKNYGDKYQPLYDFVKNIFENNRGNNAN